MTAFMAVIGIIVVIAVVYFIMKKAYLASGMRHKTSFNLSTVESTSRKNCLTNGIIISILEERRI
mgnify:CR=1 FL=1